MAFRVPLLLQKSVAVIHRLDVAATRAYDPSGEATSGYNDLLGEPVAYAGTSGVTTSSRQEMTAIRVPCQVETPKFQELQQFGPGAVQDTKLVLVLHRQDLATLSLLDPTTRAPLLKPGDRISAIERYGASGVSQQPIAAPGLYITEMRPASWGFGPEGHDLELALLADRPRAS